MLLPPKVRGYAAERLLGRGAAGDVWQARVLATGERVALKRIAVSGPEQLQRAETEAALLAALEHANLIRLHALVPVEDAVVLVLDLAEGGSLAGLLTARGRLAPGEVITAVAPVAAALAYLHDEGIVHADVSTANILFSAAGQPLLADVGVARLTGDDRDAEATPAYVDPLVAAGCVPGPESDVFMLGGVALHALTGAPPWPEPDPEAALARAAAGSLDDVAARLAAAQVPPAMTEVVCRALQREPQRRGTAADFALDLRHSGDPLAVELAAGRPVELPVARLWTGPRHAVGRPVALAAEPAGPPAEVPGRRPSAAAESVARVAARVGSPPPTRMVSPRPRPVVPRPARGRLGRRGAVLAAAAAVAVAVAAAVAVGWFGGGAGRHRAHDGLQARADVVSAAGRTPAGAAAHRAASHVPSAAHLPTAGLQPGPGSAAAGRRPPGASIDWLAQLRRLDAVRGQAYAQRRPALLRQVYRSPRLLRSDAAVLIRTVPAGCGLVGVRSRFAAAAVHPAASGAVVTVTATVSASRLLCGGALRATAAGSVPARLRFVLARTTRGVRIVAERQLGA